jgi:hypothetical protein
MLNGGIWKVVGVSLRGSRSHAEDGLQFLHWGAPVIGHIGCNRDAAHGRFDLLTGCLLVRKELGAGACQYGVAGHASQRAGAKGRGLQRARVAHGMQLDAKGLKLARARQCVGQGLGQKSEHFQADAFLLQHVGQCLAKGQHTGIVIGDCQQRCGVDIEHNGVGLLIGPGLQHLGVAPVQFGVDVMCQGGLCAGRFQLGHQCLGRHAGWQDCMAANAPACGGWGGGGCVAEFGVGELIGRHGKAGG